MPAKQSPPKELQDVCEILPGRLFFAASRSLPANTPSCVFFSIDDELHYEGFYADFGPLNLAMLYKYCSRLYGILMDSSHKGKAVYHITGLEAFKRPNAAYLIGAFSVLYLNRSAETAYRPIAAVAAGFHPFRDASYGPCAFKLTVLDCLRGVHQAMLHRFLDFSTFDLKEYEHYERVEHGDLNWVVPGKFVAFAGPHNERVCDNGYLLHAPDDYFDYFRRRDVQAIVRLNNKVYDSLRFVAAGFQHHELFFPDGSVPPDAIVAQFLDVSERTQGGLAVHCKAGLGRTGTLIACFVMKHYALTASECIAWLRIARPGSVLGPQQFFLQEKQASMWRMGEHLGVKRADEDRRPAWSSMAFAALLAEGAVPGDALPDMTPSDPSAPGSVASITSGLHGLSLGPPRTPLLPPLVEDARAGSYEGRSQGDFLMARKAMHLRVRSLSIDTLAGRPLAPRTRNASVTSPFRVSGKSVAWQQAPLKSSKVRRPGEK